LTVSSTTTMTKPLAHYLLMQGLRRKALDVRALARAFPRGMAAVLR
jgi:hypothetical protein